MGYDESYDSWKPYANLRDSILPHFLALVFLPTREKSYSVDIHQISPSKPPSWTQFSILSKVDFLPLYSHWRSVIGFRNFFRQQKSNIAKISVLQLPSPNYCSLEPFQTLDSDVNPLSFLNVVIFLFFYISELSVCESSNTTFKFRLFPVTKKYENMFRITTRNIICLGPKVVIIYRNFPNIICCAWHHGDPSARTYRPTSLLQERDRNEKVQEILPSSAKVFGFFHQRF